MEKIEFNHEAELIGETLGVSKDFDTLIDDLLELHVPNNRDAGKLIEAILSSTDCIFSGKELLYVGYRVGSLVGQHLAD